MKSTRQKSFRTNYRNRKTIRHRSRKRKYDGTEPEEYLWIFRYTDPEYVSSIDWDDHPPLPNFNPDFETWDGLSYLIIVKSQDKPIDTIYNYLVSKNYINNSTLSEVEIKSIIDRKTVRKDDGFYSQIISYEMEMR